MRHRSMFIYKKTRKEFLDWFSDEIKSTNSNLKIEIIESKYDSLMSIRNGEDEMEFSIFNSPERPECLWLYAKPKLKFIAAILGKNDILRERATQLAHSILKDSDEISELGWYLENNVWKGPTSTP